MDHAANHAARAPGMNHLAGEPSLYLQQHAANPLDWHPWSDEALEKARAEDKPLFVSVGYSSCHWCHVMEHEVFEDGEVAELMNAHFIAIKIDREERPDLDAVFMEALHVLTGAGGWPLNLFLTPELKPFYGATYLPRGQFLDVARQIVQLHQRDRDRLEQAGAEVARILAARPVIGGGALPGKDLLARAAESALEQLDPDWGGFRGRMKFPLPPRLEFLLGRYRREGDQRLGYALALTLDAIAGGGIRDHLGGGFHRYATDEAWIVPHFEKMLYDNAQLASLYLEAGAAFKRPDLRAVALDTLDFMLERMRAGEGGAFCASYDADSGGVEGAYYTWTPDEIIAVAGKDDGLLLCRLLGVTPAGNFEGGNVLTRRIPAEDLARERGVSAEDVERTYLKWRPALLAERDRRTAPARDAKVVTAWNGMALRALALAALATGGERYLQAAEEAAAYLLARHVRPDGRLWRATTDGVARGEGVLDDYAWLARGLCALFQASGRPAYLRQALGLIDAAFALFAREGGGFSLATADADAPLGAPEPLFDNVEPAGASTLLRALLEAGTLTARRDYIERVRSELARHGGLLAQAGMEMAGWLSALELVLGPLPCVIVTGRRDNPAARKLRDAFGAQLPPHAMLVQATPDAAAELGGLVPPAEGKDAADPAAHNCTQDACLPPVRDAAELRRLLREGWQA